MYVDPRGVSQSSAALGFVLLFPGFALYHYFAASGWIPLFLGGLFGNVALAITILCLLLSFWLLRARVWGGLAQARFFLVSWVFFMAWTGVGYASVASEPYGGPALREALSSLTIWLAVFFVGSFYPIGARAQQLLLRGSALLLAAMIIHAIVVHESLLGPLQVFLPGSALRISTYQGVGRSIMVTAIVLSALYPQSWKQLAILSLAVVALLALGSRSHLFTTLALLVAILFLAALRARRRAALVAFTLVAAAGVWFGWSAFLDTRAAEILDLSRSTSWQGRLEVQAIALDVIRKSPVLGEFGYHFREIGAGGYAHNALSAWAEFGLVGFVLFCVLIVYFTALSLKKLLSRDTATALWRVAFGLNMASAVLAVASEPVFSAVPALGWGFAVNALLEERRNHVIISHA